jgi:hypothetical protein
LISGASDLVIKISDPETLEVIRLLETEFIPRSVDIGKKFLVIGFKNGTIVERDFTGKGKEEIMHSHHDGELWGLCVIEG